MLYCLKKKDILKNEELFISIDRYIDIIVLSHKHREIFQNAIFCVPEMKESHTGFE